MFFRNFRKHSTRLSRYTRSYPPLQKISEFHFTVHHKNIHMYYHIFQQMNDLFSEPIFVLSNRWSSVNIRLFPMLLIKKFTLGADLLQYENDYFFRKSHMYVKKYILLTKFISSFVTPIIQGNTYTKLIILVQKNLSFLYQRYGQIYHRKLV